MISCPYCLAVLPLLLMLPAKTGWCCCCFCHELRLPLLLAEADCLPALPLCQSGVPKVAGFGTSAALAAAAAGEATGGDVFGGGAGTGAEPDPSAYSPPETFRQPAVLGGKPSDVWSFGTSSASRRAGCLSAAAS